MEIYYLISALISIIILVCYFKLCANVSNIKDELRNIKTEIPTLREQRKYSYHTNRTLGKNKEAAEDLTFILIYDLTSEEMTATERAVKYDEFKERNASKFADLGYPFPDYKF
jgi:hypothetical protein